jgi:hypothetical protein
MAGLLKRVTEERVSGGRPSVVRAVIAAVVAGVGAALITYRLLRG